MIGPLLGPRRQQHGVFSPTRPRPVRAAPPRPGATRLPEQILSHDNVGFAPEGGADM
jgi:hypothetical protein